MSEEERVGIELGRVVAIAGGVEDGLETGVSDGGGGNESRAGVELAERVERDCATEGGISSVRGVAWRTEARK